MTVTLTAVRVPLLGARLLVLWAVAVLVWWGFAFFPTPPGDDSWIAAAQAACFGSLPGGLPAVQGWMMLTLAPAMLLVTLFVAFQAELREALPALRRSRGWLGLALALVCLGVVELGFAAVRVQRAVRIANTSFSPTLTGPLPESYPRAADAVAAFTLVDEHGAEITAAAFTGKPTVLSFVFAHCTTACPVMIQTLARSTRELGDDAQVVIVTLDPWRDTPATLSPTLAGWPLSKDTRLLSGDPDAVARWLDAMGVARERDLRTGDVSHVPLVMVIDAGGHIAYRFNNPPAEWVVEAVRRVQRGS